MSVNIYDADTGTLTRVDNSYGIINCSTARSTAAKVVALSGFKLYEGARITVRFTDTGSSNPSSGNLSLNVNSTGAKTIVDGHTNKTVLTYSNANYFYNNQVADFVYDGANWVYLNRDKDTTYNGSSLKTNAAKTGTAQSAITDTIAASTTMDNAIGTLLNNDKTLESDVQTLESDIQTLSNQAQNKVLYLTGIACSATAGNFVSYSNSAITADHVVAECVFANLSAIISNVLSWTTANGSLVINGTCSTATTVDVVLIKKDN